MKRRVAGIETEFGLTVVTSDGRRAHEVEQAARDLFRPVVAWGRSSNVFLTNGARLYLDVGSHPEYATAECDDTWDLVAQDRAGEREFEQLVAQANAAYQEKGVDARIHLLKNNSDSEGNSFGSHENFMIERRGEFTRLPQMLVPFLITRQIVTGAGGVIHDEDGARFGFSLRSDHMWETVSSATTRARPIINTRDEPHGDPTKFRRLHVIVGDSTMSELSTWMRIEMTNAVLRLIEAGRPVGTIALKDPIAAIRVVARDLTGTAPLELADGGTITALQIQRRFLEAVTSAFDDLDERMLDLWDRALRAVETQDFSLVSRELDWAIKHDLFHAVAERRGLALDDPQIQRLEFAYHDIDRTKGVFWALQRRGLAPQILSDERIEQARTQAPATTRAHLRGRVLHAARDAGTDVAVDWTSVRLNAPGQRPISMLDPFQTESAEIDALIDDIRSRSEAADPASPGGNP
ncbi:Pup--protein ligase [Helcobacillus sp. ACRRO]|uniref:Pup--protein ligase n=1 Tax=Helcobacillus sp. ACRRO TaxID=2918202 RepID=UPI001EF5D08F|nr:Pup--protein ligase [Helcobacillus sp. ACRRO]